MSYRGSGYGYQYSAPDNRQANPYALGRNNIADPPPAANSIQNAGRGYQPTPGWQGQNPRSLGKPSLPSSNYWMGNSNNTQRQDQPSYPQQPSSRNASGLNPNTGQQQVHQDQFNPQTARRAVSNTTAYGNGNLNDAGSRSVTPTLNGGLYYQNNQQPQASPAATASLALNYQSNTMEPLQRPASGQRERDAAASAMTALSSSAPSRSLPQSQQQQYSIPATTNISNPTSSAVNTADHRNSVQESNVFAAQAANQNMNQYTTGPPPLHSRNNNNATAYSGRSSHSPSMATAPQQAPQQRSPQVQQSQSPNMAPTAPRGPVNAGPPQQPSGSQSSHRVPSVASVLQPNQNPDPATTSHNQADNPPNQANKDSFSAATMQSASSLANFVDPTQIYNPYHLEMKAAMERRVQEEKAEEGRRQIAEAEAEAARRREDEERRRREEQAREEAEVRKHLEATGQASSHPVSHQNPGTPTTEGGTEATAPDNTAATTQVQQETDPQQASHQKPQQKRQRKTQKKTRKPDQQNTEQSTPKRKGREKKSEPANGDTSSGQRASTDGNTTAGNPDEPEDDMAMEMKNMIGKMQKWKKQDPSLFAELLDGLKVQNNPKSLEIAQQSNTTNASQPLGDNATEQQSAHPEGQLPDLGKFPAARRRRSQKAKNTTNTSSVTTAPEGPATGKGTDLSTQESAPGLGKFPAARRKRRSGKVETPANDAVAVGSNAEVPMDDPEVSKDAEVAQDAVSQEQPAQPEQPSQATEQPTESQSSSKSPNIWPKDKRQALAEAACEYLNNVAHNKSNGKTCQPSLIVELIEQNPTYSEICGLIESRGYSVSRVNFAKHLIKEVPDLTSSNAGGASQSSEQTTEATTTSPALSESQPQVVQTDSSPPGSTSVPSVGAVSFTPPSHPNIPPPASTANPPAASHRISLDNKYSAPLGPGSTTSTSGPPGSTSVPSVGAVSFTSPSHPNRPPPASTANPPVVFRHVSFGNKYSAPHGPSGTTSTPGPPTTSSRFQFAPVAIPGTVPGPGTAPGAPVHPQSGSQMPAQPPVAVPGMVPGPGTAPGAPVRPQSGSQMPAQPPVAPHSSHSYRPSYKLAPKLRVPAPPAHRPPPGSKEALARKRNFSDIVDLTQTLSGDEEDVSPSSKAPRVESSTEHEDAQQSQPHAGPQLQGSQAQLQPPKSLDLSRFKADKSPSDKHEALQRRNDIVKPINKAQAVRKSYYDPRTIARDILIAAGRHPTDRPLNSHLTKLREKFNHVDNSSNLETFRWDVVDPGGPPRPEVAPEPLVTKAPELPKLHNQTPHDYDTSDDRPPNSDSRSDRDLKLKPSSLRISHTVGDDDDGDEKETGESAPAIDNKSSEPTQAAEAPPPRRPGRPRKNEPALSAMAQGQQLQVVIPASSAMKTPSKHQVYKCQWGSCDAKLHSLAVLQKHLLRVHLPNSTVCRWTGCSAEGNGERSVSTRVYNTEELRQHLLESHMSELAWQKGEGPRPIPSDQLNRDLDSCLDDGRGRPVIPQASTRGAPPTLILPAAYASIRSFNKMRGNESDRSKAQEVVRALEAKQATVGVGVNQGGCTLMNATRQKTVPAFEEVFEIVPENN